MLNLGPPIIERIASEVKARPDQVQKTVDLLNAGSTIPFIARYRKDVTGNLNEEKLEKVGHLNEYFIALEQRREAILQNIEKQGKLTDALREAIAGCMDKSGLEDLYLPYKKKRRTKASVAREQGLEPLADYLLAQDASAETPDQKAGAFVNAEKGIASAEQALEGALHILAERISEDAAVRSLPREKMMAGGKVASSSTRLSEGKKTKYNTYYEFTEAVKSIPSHRFLAIVRGVKEGILRMDIAFDDGPVIEEIVGRFLKEPGSAFEPLIRAVVEDSYQRLLRPSIENEVTTAVRQRSDENAIRVFRDNAKNLLLSPPAGRMAVLGVDPGLRTGCKLAVIDDTGAATDHATIFPDGSDEQKKEASETLRSLIERRSVEAVAIGNGTGSREASAFVRRVLKETDGRQPMCVLANEAGASVYSASKLAREELPDLDVTIRGAVSIARRLQDPLAELVKIEPRSIGVGQYQHDVNQKGLREGLHQTVVSCVNRVGVDLNTASVPLLRYVSGIQYGTAQNIVAYRTEKGGFASREQLLEVPGVGPKVYEQCVGFLRIAGAENVLDSTSIHPESYAIIDEIAKKLEKAPSELVGNGDILGKLDLSDFETDTVGKISLEDIRRELLRPGRDPRKQFRAPKFLDGISDVSDVEKGMELEGVVTNVTDFGAFVDVGVHQDGLVHLSELANRFVRDPREVVRVGEVVKVKVIEVDKDAPRISLSIKALQPAAKAPAKRRARAEGEAERKPRGDSSKRPSRPQKGKDKDKRKSSKSRGPGKGSRGKPAKAPVRVHESGDQSPMNTQLADQLEALKEQLSSR